MSTQFENTKLVNLLEGQATTLREYGPWQAAFFARDHRDQPDKALINKAINTIQYPIVFEFGNRMIDEIVTVVTNCQGLEEWINASPENEATGHDAALTEEEVINFSSFEELEEIAHDAVRTLTGEDNEDY